MKNILVILLLAIAFSATSQDFRVIDWKTNVSNVELVGITDTFEFDADPTDLNDKGAPTREIGNYFIDFVARCFEIIGSTDSTITVVDLAGENTAPQTEQVGRVYQSVSGENPIYESIGGVDVSVIDELSRWRDVARNNELFARAINTKQDTMPFQTLIMDTTYVPTGTEAKGTGYWDDDNRTISVSLGNGVVMQINQEALIQLYNNTSDTLFDGRVVGFESVVNEQIAVGYAASDRRYSYLGATTENIPPDSLGFAVAVVGKLNNINTGALSVGAVFVDTLGHFTNTPPQFPEYIYPVGICLKTGVTDGIIQFASDGVNYRNSIIDAFDGAFRETFDFRTFSDGVNTYGVLSNPAGRDSLTLMFSTGWFDFAVPDTITLTSGTSTNPQFSYVYVDIATQTLQSSIVGFPETENAEVAKIALLDAATTQTNGALRNQNINNHLKYDNDNGHIVHLGDRIRVLNAEWEDGVASTVSGTPTNFYIATTSGNVWQMHKQTFPSHDMSAGDDVHIVNDPVSPYATTTNLNTVTTYSDGLTWNNEWQNLVLWGVGNKSGEVSHIMINLASGGYTSESNAYNDADGKTNYTIPRAFRGVGFLIGRFTVRRSPAGYTYTPSTGFLDLRGFYPNNTAGGGAGGSSGYTEFTQLDDTPSSYLGSGTYFLRVNSAENGVEFTAPSSITLTDFDSTGFTVTQSQVVGLEDTILNHRDAITALEALSHPAVTLAGTPDYITIDGNQVITRNQIDLTTDVTGVLPDANVADDITLTNITQITNRSHTNLQDIGTNTHAQIDIDLTRLANTSGTNTGDQDISGIQDNADSLVVHRNDINQNASDILALDNSAVKTVNSISPTAGNVDVTNPTTGYLPYKNGNIFSDSPAYTDGINFGIGTTLPTYSIHNKTSGGDLSSGVATNGSTMKGLYLENSVGTANNALGLWFFHGALHAGIASTRRNTSNWGTDLRFYTHQQSIVDLNTATERMRLTSEGNLMLYDTYNGSLTKELSGEILDYGVNYAQSGEYDASHSGSFFRIDTRPALIGHQIFSVIHQAVPGSGETNIFSLGTNAALFAAPVTHAQGTLNTHSALRGDLLGGTENIDGLTLSYNGTDMLDIISDSVPDYGLDTEIPVTNATGDGFVYSSGFYYNVSSNFLYNDGRISLADSYYNTEYSSKTHIGDGGTLWVGTDGLPYFTNDNTTYLLSSSGVTDHSLLSNLDYASSGHTGFARTGGTNTFTSKQTVSTNSSVVEGMHVINANTSGNGLRVSAGLDTEYILRLTQYDQSTSKFDFTADGKARFYGYGSGSITGTAAKYLAVDASGNIIEEDATGGLTSVGITGSDFVITNSPLTSNGNIGLSIGSGVVGSTELASTAVSAGSYTNASITVDADGRLTAASSVAFSGSKVTRTSNLTISSSSGTTVTFDSEDFDTDSYHSTSSNTERLSVPEAGYYRISFIGTLVVSTDLGGLEFALYKTGTNRIAYVIEYDNDDTNLQSSICYSDIHYLTTSDYVYVSVRARNSDATLYGSADLLSFSIEKL